MQKECFVDGAHRFRVTIGNLNGICSIMTETMNGKSLKAISLGVLRAEDDTEMLRNAFIETADYRTLIETSDRVIVVGRRGTGKSALTSQLQKHWQGVDTANIIRIIPKEHQIIGLRPLISRFGEKFNLVKAGSKLIWRYALVMEAAIALRPHYKFKKNVDSFLERAINRWPSTNIDVTEKVKRLLSSNLKNDKSPEELIGELPAQLELEELEKAVAALCSDLGHQLVVLVDRLDEGYEPDHVGVGFIDGLVQATIHLKTKIPEIKPIVFIRDNIFRSVQIQDLDYTRNIEGHVLRLHWDEATLFNFATKRIAISLNISHESSLKIWNACAVGQLSGKEGFTKCLKLTLYRPRDLLALLNEAFLAGARHETQHLEFQHIESSADQISLNRFNDLIKEYSDEVPGLAAYAGAFRGKDPEQSVKNAISYLEEIFSKGSTNSKVQQDIFILEDAKSAIPALYSVGFLGIQEGVTGKFVFCHDGRSANKEFQMGDAILVHPCYWMAINCNRTTLSPEEAEEIYDEYDIEISSKTPEIRAQKIDALIDSLNSINEGFEQSALFEEWCVKAIRICFARGLRNVDLIPSRTEKGRKHVIGTNLGEYGFWKRILEEYSAKQVVFNICNYHSLERIDYDSTVKGLDSECGKFAVVVSRDKNEDLYAGVDLEWVREIYSSQKVLVIKITAKLLVKLLNKLKKPQKHNAVDDELHRLLDIYLRLYIHGQAKARVEKKNKRQLKKAVKKALEHVNSKILFLSADPSDASRLRLAEEQREIQEKLRLGNYRDSCSIEIRTSVRPQDISQALLDISPRIVHFSGHGTSAGKLCFEDKLGKTKPIDKDALSSLFAQFSNDIECVVLNACYSEDQANAVAKHIHYVVGMKKEISDDAAIAFSTGFYQAISGGRSIVSAFDLGLTQISLQGINERSIPKLIQRQ